MYESRNLMCIYKTTTTSNEDSFCSLTFSLNFFFHKYFKNFLIAENWGKKKIKLKLIVSQLHPISNKQSYQDLNFFYQIYYIKTKKILISLYIINSGLCPFNIHRLYINNKHNVYIILLYGIIHIIKMHFQNT